MRKILGLIHKMFGVAVVIAVLALFDQQASACDPTTALFQQQLAVPQFQSSYQFQSAQGFAVQSQFSTFSVQPAFVQPAFGSLIINQRFGRRGIGASGGVGFNGIGLGVSPFALDSGFGFNSFGIGGVGVGVGISGRGLHLNRGGIGLGLGGLGNHARGLRGGAGLHLRR